MEHEPLRPASPASPEAESARSADQAPATGALLTPDRLAGLQPATGNRAVARIAAGWPARYTLARAPAVKVIKFAASWLAKREAKMVSGHIARHGRRIAERAIHSVFRSPKDIRWLLDRALKHATEVAERHAGEDVIVEEGIKIERQGTRRWAVNRSFQSAIGTDGETVLRMILNHNGRIVTAYPVRTLAALGIVGTAALAFDEKVANAAEGVASLSQEAAMRKSQRDDSWFGDWEEWIPYLGDIYGGTLNEDEDLMVKEDQLIYGTANALQEAAAQTWTPEQYQRAVTAIRSAIGAPYYVDDDASAQMQSPTGVLDGPADAPERTEDSSTVPV